MTNLLAKIPPINLQHLEQIVDTSAEQHKGNIKMFDQEGGSEGTNSSSRLLECIKQLEGVEANMNLVWPFPSISFLDLHLEFL